MAYEVTATKKRPQVFDTLVGQEFVVSTIKNSIEQGRVAHAYLFSGPRGVGKTSSARILAKALNCENGPTPYPCGVCSSCKEITAGNSTDVIEIDGASNTSVNDVRIIKDEVLFPPQSSRYKIYIIDEVHMLSTSAFNALLKTIEEPPAYVLFIFATTETHKVPATIRSRCQQFHFQLIPLETIKHALKANADEIGVTAEDEALFWIAKESTGSMRDAYTLFDQVLSFSDGHITLDSILQKLGIAGVDSINTLMTHIIEEDSKMSMLLLDEILTSGVSVEQCIKDITSYIRVLLLIKRNIVNESILGMQISSINSAVIATYNEEQLEAALYMFLQLYKEVRYSLSPRFELELAVSRLITLKQMMSSSRLVKHIQDLKLSLSDSTAIPTMKKVEKRQEVPKSETIQEISTPRNNFVEPPKEEIVEKAPQKEVEQTKVVNTHHEIIVEPKKIEEKVITIEIIREMSQLLAEQRDSVGMLLHQVVGIDYKKENLTIMFSSIYVVNQAKEHTTRLKEIFLQHCGFTGILQYELEKKEEEKAKDTTDKIVQNIASMFRGEIVTK